MAWAAQANDARQLAALGTAGGLRVDAPEPRFGKTVLMLAVANGNYAACQALLRLGAGPNVHDHYNVSSAMLEAARRPEPLFVKLLLAHAGNPNDVETGPRQHATQHPLATCRRPVAGHDAGPTGRWG